MEALRVFIVTLLILGAAGSLDEGDFDLSDALGVPDTPRGPQPPQRNKENEQCPNKARDIVFLLHGSSNVRLSEFVYMKMFLEAIMNNFPNNTLFSLMQFSHRFEEHFDFRHFHRNRHPDHLTSQVRQLGGSSHTASAIRKAVRESFTLQKGARNTATKILVVVAAGPKSGDPLAYPEVIREADRAGIVRFAVGVGLGFASASVQQELQTIASHPSSEHVFQVKLFSGLRDLHTQLKEKICGIHGQVAPQSTGSPDTCPSSSSPQVLQKLERVLSGLEQITTKLNLLVAREGKCGRH